MSYQQSFNLNSEFQFANGESYQSPDQSSAVMAFALGYVFHLIRLLTVQLALV